MQTKYTQLTGLQTAALLPQVERIELLRFGDIKTLKQVLNKLDMVVQMSNRSINKVAIEQSMRLFTSLLESNLCS